MIMPSDTPRTDERAEPTTSFRGIIEVVPANFARELELEVNALHRNNLLLTEILHKTLEDYALSKTQPPTPNIPRNQNSQ